jgi:2-keto-4-pentenoate hydratase/2-oxohepta-3-ene-1,7-dioic acid hydratase in catechol pathway
MKLVTYLTPANETSLGLLRGGRIYDIAGLSALVGAWLPADMIEFLELGEEGRQTMSALLAYLDAGVAPSWPAEAVTLLAPIQKPGKVLAVAANFQSHIKEGGGNEVNKARITPRFFLKPSNSTVGPDGIILRPKLSTTVDYELELGVVIGRPARYVSVEKALSYVAGYTIFNDVSARTLTLAEMRDARPWDDFFDWLNGKWFDSFSAMGPYVATADEIPDPQNLAMRLWVNGELRQEGNSSQMIFNVAELVSFISQITTLEPGDIIATGTPAGVGATTGRYLNAGDQVVGAIQGLGELRNTVANDPMVK